MNTHHTYHSSSRRGFTLIELLVVITIIAVLVGLASPAYNIVMRKARELQAKAAMQGLILAIKNFEVEYNKMPNVAPNPPADPTTDAEPFDTGEGNTVLACLLAKDDTLNPRKIPYYDPPPGKGTSGYYLTDPTDPKSGVLNDPWGKPYHIAMDTNGDGVIKNPYYTGDPGDQEQEMIGAKVIVYSSGTNGILYFDDDNKVKDDIKSWK